MRITILLSFLLLAGCNSVSGVQPTKYWFPLEKLDPTKKAEARSKYAQSDAVCRGDAIQAAANVQQPAYYNDNSTVIQNSVVNSPVIVGGPRYAPYNYGQNNQTNNNNHSLNRNFANLRNQDTQKNVRNGTFIACMARNGWIWRERRADDISMKE